MAGLALLAILGLYFFLATKVFKAAKTTLTKVIAGLLIVLIPTGDAIYGRIKLRQMCKAEVGLKVYRVAEHVDGFMGYADENLVREYGYQFVETERYSRPGNYIYTRYFRFARNNGEFVIEEDDNPKSKYRFRSINGNNKKIYSRSQYVIENIATGEILASDTNLAFRGGWFERFLDHFDGDVGDNVAHCSNIPDSLIRIENLIKSTLKP